MTIHEAPRVEVPKPHMFSGKRDAKELDNFLWHMEHYFKAIALTDEATKMCTIDTWDVFKREIKKKFYSEDVVYLARKNMKHLKHTGSIHDWTKQELRRRGVQDLAMTMVIVESLVEYKKGESSKPKPQSKDNHAKGRRYDGLRGRGNARVGSLQLLNALKAKLVPKTPQSKGLMYVEALVNGKATKVLVDTGITHNFVSEDEAKRLELQASKE
ncbi:hypothetical protein AAG906_007078 [Vitis piasezkii]